MIEDKNDFMEYYSKMEQYAFILGEVANHVRGIKGMILENEIPELLMDFIENEYKFLMINYAFFYFGVKKQLVNEEQYEDAIRTAKELMGFESEESKNRARSAQLTSEAMFHGAFYQFEKAYKALDEAIKLDPDNPQAWHWLSELYTEDGEFKKAKNARSTSEKIAKKLRDKRSKLKIGQDSKKAFKSLMNAFLEKRALLEALWKKPAYSEFLFPSQGLLSQYSAILNDLRNYFRGKDHWIPEDKIEEAFSDVVNVIFEWMSIVSGLSFYILNHDQGTEEQVQDVADALLKVLGWPEHVNLNESGDQLSTIPKGPDIFNLDEEEQEAEEEAFFDLDEEDESWFDLDLEEGDTVYFNISRDSEFGKLPVRVIDYEEKDVVDHLIDPDTQIIDDESIKIQFSYPLSVTVERMFHNSGGFSRIDVFRSIYEGYKKIYDEEEAVTGDPGTVSERVLNRAQSNGPYGIWGHELGNLIIERVHYDRKTKTLGMFIGS